MKFRFFIMIFLVFFISGCHFVTHEERVKSRQEILDGLDTLRDSIDQMMKDYSVEKVSIAIISNNELIWSEGFNIGVNDRLQAASISKVVSSYCALKLVESGKLSLDKPLNKYISKQYITNTHFSNIISLRMVLNHTSGLRNDITGNDRTIYYEPGTKFLYSGGGFTYLQNVIESVTGEPYDTYMENSVLSALNMNNSKFSFKIDGEKQVMAGASLVTTPTELASFFIELMDPQNIDKNLINTMLSPSIQVNDNVSWCLGVGYQHGKYEDAYWHWGNNNNEYHTLAIMFKESMTGVIIMTKGFNGYLIYKDIAYNAIGGEHYQYWFNIPVW